MIILDTPNKTFQLSLANTVNTTEMPFTCGYKSISPVGVITLVSVTGTTNKGAKVIIMPAPQAGYVNELIGFSLVNEDVARNVVTVYIYDGTTFTTMFYTVMRPGRTLLWPQDKSFVLYTPGLS